MGLSALHPYRVPEHPEPDPGLPPVDPLWDAQRLTSHLVVCWAVLRVAACSARGLDLEGFLALLLVVAVLASLTRSFS
jgi:hypothetical protein